MCVGFCFNLVIFSCSVHLAFVFSSIFLFPFFKFQFDMILKVALLALTFFLVNMFSLSLFGAHTCT